MVKTKFGPDITCTQTIYESDGDIDTLLIAGSAEPVRTVSPA